MLQEIDLPDGWRWMRLCVATRRIQETGKPEAEPLSVFLNAGVIPRESRSDNHNNLGEDLGKYQYVRVGDVVFNKLRTWQGGLGVSPRDGIVSPAYYVCRPNSGWSPRYLNYLLLSRPYLSELTRISKFMPPSQFDVPWDSLRLLPLLHPPLDEQQRIVDFLDAKVDAIDRLLEANRRLVDLNNDRVDARVRTVIGRSKIASVDGSDLVPLKRLIVKLQRRATQDSIVSEFRDGQVVARDERRTHGFTESAKSDPYVQGVEVGDVVVHGLDGFAGSIGDSESSGICSPVYHVCLPRDSGDAAFYGRLLRILALDGYLSLFGGSARERAIDFRNWERFGSKQSGPRVSWGGSVLLAGV